MPALRTLFRQGSLLLVAVGIIGVTYTGFRLVHEKWAASHDLRQFPPPGRLVDVDGIRMHLHCTGAGAPTVVLDAGLGEFSHTWQGLQPDLAAFTRVCSYDRAGYGWSESSPHPRTSQQIANELYTLLQAAEEPGPFLLVGHSMGGFHVRLFAQTYPSETAAIVLLDASHEDMGEQLPGVKRFPQRVNQLRNQARDARWGNLRNQPTTPLLPGVPAHLRSADHRLKRHTAYLEAVANELDLLMTTSADQVRAARDLGDLPVYVISRSPEWRGAAGLQARTGIAVDSIWHAYQQDLASLSTNSHHFVADTSGHYVHLEAPQLVRNILYNAVDEIRHQAQQTPSVFLNHMNRVLDAETYHAIAAHPFIQNVFASTVQTTVNSGKQTWTGMYLFGEHTYIELFASGTGVQRPPGSSALAFGVEATGDATTIHDRLQTLDATATHTLRTRTLGTEDVPWFYQASRNASRFTDVVRSWVMEIHPDYMTTRFPDLDNTQNGIARHHYLHRIYRPNRLLQDIRHLTVAVPAQEKDALLRELQAFGYTLTTEGLATHATGPGITLTLMPATETQQGIICIGLALTRPHQGPSRYQLGQSTLQFHNDGTATWTF